MDTDRENRLDATTADDVLAWQGDIVRVMLLAAAIVGTLAVIGMLYEAYLTGQVWQVPLGLSGYGLLVAVTAWQRAPYKLRAAALLGLLFGLGLANLLVSPHLADGLLFLLVVPAIAMWWFAG